MSHRPYVYITRNVPESALGVLPSIADIKMWPEEEKQVPRDVLLQEAAQASGLVTMLTEKVDSKLLKQAKHLQVVSNVAVGYDNIDIQAATEQGVTVTNTPDVLTDTTADLGFALLMATARRIVESAEYIKNNQWSHWSPMLMAGQDIHHRTIGIVGMGRIGEAIARRATGFGMTIIYHNRTRKPEAEENLGAHYVDFDELLATADFIVSAAPLTEETRNLFDQRAFAKMKNSAIFINISRGGIVDEKALEEALAQEKIAGAGLDVFRNEPIGADHPLLAYHNVVALPHIGSASEKTRMDMISLACDNAARVLQGQKPETSINWNDIHKPNKSDES